MRRACVAGALVSAVLAACGGGDSGSDQAPAKPASEAPPGTIPKADFLRRADAICAASDKKLKPLYKRRRGTLAQLNRWLSQEARIEAARLRKLRALPPPDYHERLLKLYLSRLEDVVDAHRALAARAKAGDAAGFDRYERKRARAMSEETRAANFFRFRDCGQTV